MVGRCTFTTTPEGIPSTCWPTKASDIYRFFLGPVLALPLVVMLAINPWQFFRKSITGKTGFLVAVCGATFIGVALPIYFIPHYVAPITAAIYALVLQAMRYLRLWRWRGKRAGLGLVRAIPAICVLLFLLRAFAPQLHIPTPVDWSTPGSPSIIRTWTVPRPWRNWRHCRATSSSLCGTINIIIRIMNGCITGRISTAQKSCGRVTWATPEMPS